VETKDILGKTSKRLLHKKINTLVWESCALCNARNCRSSLFCSKNNETERLL